MSECFDVLIRGAGELASAIAIRLYRAGYRIALTEIENPLCIRRSISFSDAVYDGQKEVEGVTAVRYELLKDHKNMIPLFVTEDIPDIEFASLVDARMLKRHVNYSDIMKKNIVVVGIGPGFVAPENCNACVETKRGYYLGRSIYSGSTAPDTGTPAPVLGKIERVVWSPEDGIFTTKKELGEWVSKDSPLGEVSYHKIFSPIDGLIRGLIRNNTPVKKGTKLVDIDPRNEKAYLYRVSDKGLAVAGGVIEVLLHFGILPEGNIRTKD